MRLRKRRIRHICVALLVALMFVVSACGKKEVIVDENGELVGGEEELKAAKVEEKELDPESVVMVVGDEEVTYREMMVYNYILKDKYQGTFGDGLWDFKLGNGKTIRSVTNAQIIDLITKIKIINMQAKDLGVSLSGDEKEDIRKYCGSLYDEISDKTRSDYLLNEDMITLVFCENEIANKVYDSCIDGVSTSISDEDSRMCTVQYIYLQTSGVNQSGVKVNLSEKNIQKRYKEAVKLRKTAKTVEDFYTFAEANTEAKDVQISFARGDMSDEFTDAAFALKKGQLSTVVAAPEGYYIIYCVEENNEELAIQKKEELIQEEWKANFEAKYAKWAKEYEVEVSPLIL